MLPGLCLDRAEPLVPDEPSLLLLLLLLLDDCSGGICGTLVGTTGETLAYTGTSRACVRIEADDLCLLARPPRGVRLIGYRGEPSSVTSSCESDWGGGAVVLTIPARPLRLARTVLCLDSKGRATSDCSRSSFIGSDVCGRIDALFLVLSCLRISPECRLIKLGIET
jgi:hypothetical protein